MALSKAMNPSGGSDTAETNLDQFEMCTRKEGSNCVFKDTNGRCIFETCIVEEEFPPQTLLWFFECIACKEVDVIKPRDRRIHFCKNCIRQLQQAQVLPFTCIFCGATQSTRGKGFGNQMCDRCVARIGHYVNMWHCESCG